jgi:hypothetical protein
VTSGDTQNTTLRDAGSPAITFTHTSNETGAVLKTRLMHVEDGNRSDPAGPIAGRRAEGSGMRSQPTR